MFKWSAGHRFFVFLEIHEKILNNGLLNKSKQKQAAYDVHTEGNLQDMSHIPCAAESRILVPSVRPHWWTRLCGRGSHTKVVFFFTAWMSPVLYTECTRVFGTLGLNLLGTCYSEPLGNKSNNNVNEWDRATKVVNPSINSLYKLHHCYIFNVHLV